MAQPDTALGEGFLLVGEGAVGVEVQPGLLDQPGGLDLTDPARGGGDQPVREQRGLTERSVVSRAISRARHTGTSPACTRFHSRGSR